MRSFSQTYFSFGLGLLLLSVLSCYPDRGKPQSKDPQALEYNRDSIAILPFEKDSPWIPALQKRGSLGQSDLALIEIILNKAILKHNIDQLEYVLQHSQENPSKPIDKSGREINWPHYYRQYVAGKNEKGERLVWVNCFCTAEGEGWKEYVISVEDGGACYFNLLINLDKQTYHDLYVNGQA